MKTPSGPAAIAMQRPDAETLFLGKLELLLPAPLTLYFSDRYIQALGQQWLPMVKDWGTFVEDLNRLDVGGSPSRASITFFNDKPVEGTGKARLSDLIRTPRNTTGTYEFKGARFTVYELMNPSHGLGDEVLHHVFFLQEPDDLGERSLTLAMADVTLPLQDALQIPTVTREEFPLCPESAIGQSMPVPFGLIDRAPAVPIVDSVSSTLDGGIADNASTLTLKDASRFDPSGTINVDGEHMTYTAKVGQQLTGLVHGVDSTTAADHAHGATVHQVRQGDAAYRYVAAAHVGPFKARSVANVLVNGAPPAVTPTIVLDDNGRAIIDFPKHAKFFQSQAITVTRLVAVSTISTTINGGAGSPASPQTRTVAPGSVGGTTATDRIITARVVRTGNLTGTVNSWQLKRRVGAGPDVVAASGSFASGGGGTVNISHTKHYESTASEILTFEYIVNNTNDGQLQLIFDQYKVKDFTTVMAGGGPTSIGQVTCDLEGLQDDDTGSISGTPNLLLENPVDIGKLIHLHLLSGLVSAAGLGAGWAATRAKLADLGFKWAFLLGPMRYAEFRRAFGEQARSQIFVAGGKIDCKFLVGHPPADLILDYLKDASLQDALRVRRTPGAAVRTQLTVYSQRDHSAGGGLDEVYRRVTTHVDPGEATSVPGTLQLDWVQDVNTAFYLGEFWFGWQRLQRFEPELTARWNVVALDQVDHIAILNHPVLEAHGGGALRFRVQRKRTTPARRHIAIGAIDAAIVTDIGSEEALMAYGVRGLRGKNNAAAPDTRFDYTAIAVVLRNAANLIAIRHNPGTRVLDISVAGPAANARDQAAAFAANVWIHDYWIWDPVAQIDAVTSSLTPPPAGPALPSGFTHWAYLATRRLDGAGNQLRQMVTGSLVTRPNHELVSGLVSVATEQSVSGVGVWPPIALGIGGTWTKGFAAASDTASLRALTGLDSGPTMEASATAHLGGPFFMGIDAEVLFYIQSAASAAQWRIEISQYSVPNGGE